VIFARADLLVTNEKEKERGCAGEVGMVLEDIFIVQS